VIFETMKTITTQTQTGPRTVAGIRKEILKLRQRAELWARARDAMAESLRWKDYGGDERFYVKSAVLDSTEEISRCLTRALHLEYQLPENVVAKERARDWWENLERAAREAEDEAAREMGGAKRAPKRSTLEERNLAMRFWRASLLCRKKEQMVTRFYAAPWKSGVLHSVEKLHGGGSLELVEVVECSEAEYLEGVSKRAYPASGHAKWN
jgi:hypothetical protein